MEITDSENLLCPFKISLQLTDVLSYYVFMYSFQNDDFAYEGHNYTFAQIVCYMVHNMPGKSYHEFSYGFSNEMVS